MGYDTTFHPIHPSELQAYVFDVLANPVLANSRIPWLHEDLEEQNHLCQNIYNTLIATQSKMQLPKASDNSEKERLASTIAFSAAAIAGYLHPYFYSTNRCFSSLSTETGAIDDDLIVNFERLYCSEYDCSEFETEQGMVRLQGSSFSYYVKPKKIKAFRKLIANDKSSCKRLLSKENQMSLNAALEYCEAHNLGLLEAVNVATPTTGKNFSLPLNMRAAHLGNLNNLNTERYVQIFPDSIKQLTEITNKHLPLIQQGIVDIKLPFNYITKVPKETLEIVASYCNTSKAILAYSTTTPTDLLDQLSSDTTFANGPNAEVEPHYLPMLVASNRSTSSDTLNRLADLDYLTIRDCVAENANTSPATLRRLFNSIKMSKSTPENATLRRRIASNPNTPEDVLAILAANDSHVESGDKVSSNA